MKRLFIIILMFFAVCSFSASAQIVASEKPFDTDSIRRDFDNQPYFGLYKDNYFIGGIPIGHKPNSENSNVKFQISVAQKLTKSTLPWGTYLYLFYTQKVFWNVFQESLPMTDLNFNPGIGLSKPLFARGRYIGKASLVLEHESNGKDGDASRSWNKVSFGANIIIDNNIMVYGKFWIPIVDGENNRDILKYKGIYQLGLQLRSNNGRFNGSVTLVKRKSWNPVNYNTVLQFGWKIWKNANEYLFVQYYNGYGEGLLDYKKFQSMLRVGIQIKPNLFSDF